MIIKNVVNKKQNLDLLKYSASTEVEELTGYKGYNAPCIIFEDATGEVAFVVNSTDEYTALKDISDEDAMIKAKSDKIKEIRKFYNNIILENASNAADYEKESYDAQRSEWISYTADNLAPTPYIDALATQRGLTREVVIAKVGDKVLSYANVQGKQHSKEDLVKAAVTHLDINNIVLDV